MRVFDIKTVATQGIGTQKEEITTSDRGTLKKIPNGFLIRYTENIFKDAPQVFTEILVTQEKKVTVTKDGAIKSKLIIEEGEDNNCLYSTPMGAMDITVSGKRVTYLLTDTGGEIFLSYHLKQNGAIISKNEVRISIKEV